MSRHFNVMTFQLPQASGQLPVNPVLRRPKLLMIAARAGQAGWRRQKDLRRLLKCDDLPSHHHALELLMEREAQHDQARITDPARHDLRAHILCLIAILAESRALAGTAPRVPNPPLSPAEKRPQHTPDQGLSGLGAHLSG